MKTCAVCKEPFEPTHNTMQKVCSVPCSMVFAKEKKRKDRSKETRRRKTQLRNKDRNYQLQKTQEIFNRYIRLRDKDYPCISCGRYHEGQYHAGHYRTVAAHPELRFSELNCHKQCAPCNNFKSGNLVEYRINLRDRIGEKNLEWVEGHHQLQNLTIEEIIEVKKYYRDKIKTLEPKK